MLPFGSFFEELDFDDEPPARERRGPRLSRREPGGGGSGGGGDFHDEPPRVRRTLEYRRIAILVVAILVVAVVGYFWVQRCQRSAEVDSYKGYVRDANALTVRSNKAASTLQGALLEPTQTADGLVTAFAAAAKEQQAIVAGVTALHGPGKLGALQADLLEAQQFRAAGLAGIVKALPVAFGAFDSKAQAIPADKVTAVSLLYHRVLAGDIIYHDAFEVPANAVLVQKRISGITIEPSQLVAASLYSFLLPSGLSARLSAIVAGTSTGTTTTTCKSKCVYGTSIAGVSIDGKKLDPVNLNTVKTNSSTDNTIDVSVKNSGDFQLTQVVVSAFQNSLLQGKKQTILIIDPGATKVVSFPFQPVYGLKQTIKIVVDKAKLEKNVLNNIATYTVTFQLG